MHLHCFHLKIKIIHCFRSLVSGPLTPQTTITPVQTLLVQWFDTYQEGIYLLCYGAWAHTNLRPHCSCNSKSTDYREPCYSTSVVCVSAVWVVSSKVSVATCKGFPFKTISGGVLCGYKHLWGFGTFTIFIKLCSFFISEPIIGTEIKSYGLSLGCV